MQFYKIEAIIRKEEEPQVQQKEDERERTRNEKNALRSKSRDANAKHLKKQFFFVSCMRDREIILGAVCAEPTDLQGQICVFLKALGLSAEKICSSEEVTFNIMQKMLRDASRESYIDDDDEVWEQFGLGRLVRTYSRLDYGENLILQSGRAELYRVAGRLPTAQGLLQELDRIYAGKAKCRAIGHPVHYMVQTDDAPTRKESCRLLLQALYANKRLMNKRYSFVDIGADDDFSKLTYEQLYKSNAGGAVLVRCSLENTAEDEYADGGQENIETLCKIAIQYRNEVLTVFCFPTECAKIKKTFYENLGTLGIIELQEETAEGARALSLLRESAEKWGVRCDRELLGKLGDGTRYSAAQLRELFDDWYNQKLKTRIYPQYRGINTVNRKIAKAAPKGRAYDELTEMIGLTEAKKIIKQALDYFKAQNLFSGKGARFDRPAMHMVFTGNPGTAKTSVARLFAQIMRENGLLSVGKLIEVGRGDLVGKYVGWTAPTIQKKFKEAAGSVLFIDEAYSLVDDRSGSYGDEAINTIVQEMENHREDVVVILAGYPDKMEEFLQKNPGLRSRIAFHVPFEDYGTKELCEIAALIAKKKGLTLDAQAREKLADVFAIAREQSDFGNGRYARNVIEKARMMQTQRLLCKDFEKVSQKEITTLCAEDIELPARMQKAERRKIGFTA